MLLYRKKTLDVLSLHITPTSITLSAVKATRTYPAQDMYDVLLVIFQMSRLVKLIKTFVRHHGLEHPVTVIALEGEGIKEYLVHAHDEQPRFVRNFSWHQVPLSHQQSAPWYRCGMMHEQIFQFMLLAHLAELELAVLTSVTMAQLHCSHKALWVTSLDKLKKTLAPINPYQSALVLAQQYATRITPSESLW